MRPALLLLCLCAACAAPADRFATPAMESGYVDVDGGRLYYETAGDGPAVVLVHGGFGDRRMWDAQVGPLARAFRVVRYDHRGFGRSTAPDTAYSPVDDLVRLLDHLGIQQAHLVGNSLGASLVLDVALVRPERVGKVIAVAGGANGYPYTDEDIEPVRAVFRAAQEQGVEQAAAMWLRHPMVAVASRDPLVAPRLETMVRENHAFFLMAHWPSEALDPPAYERLDEVRAPVLFVVGEQDTPLVRRTVEAAAGRVAGARLVVLPGTDHLPQMEDPAAFNRLVLDSLRP